MPPTTKPTGLPDPFSRLHREAPTGGITRADGADCEEEFLRLMAMIQTLSEAKDAYELFQLAAKYTSDGPIAGEAHAILVVSTLGLVPGQYQITRRLIAVPRRRQTVEVGDDAEPTPTLSGGFVSSILRKRQPELLTNLDLSNDPALGAEFAPFDSCLFIPLFSAGKMSKRILLFRRGWDEVDFDHVERVMLIMNLIETSIENIATANRNEELNALLNAQFEQVSRIQRKLLPREHAEKRGVWDGRRNADPGPHGWLDVGMSYRTAERAGGDYYTFFELPNHRLGVLVADVAGHGADAAMVMGMLHTVVQSGVPMEEGPAAVLRYVNQRLEPLMSEGRFVTAFCAVFDPEARTVRYTSAGHPPAKLRRGGQVMELNGAGSDVIGIFEALEACEASVELQPDDLFVFFTDGITESFSPEGQAFGAGQLDVTVKAVAGTAAEMAMAIDHAASHCRGTADPDDDVTVVTVAFRTA